MIRRLLAGTAVVVALTIALSGCQARPASAAFVGDQRISIDSVDKYFEQASDDPASAELVERFPAQTRLLIVQSLIQNAVLKVVADRENLKVTESDVDQTARAIEGQRAQLDAADLVLPVELFARTQAYIRAVNAYTTPSDTSDEEADAAALRLVQEAVNAEPVEVNPRYGSFEAAQFGLVPRNGAAVVTLPTEQAQS